MVVSTLLALFTVVGAVVTTTALTLAGLWYLVTRRPTPNMRLRDALQEIDWGYAFLFFIGPCMIVGFQEGIPIFGAALGTGFVLFIVGLEWWFGPV